MITEPGFIFTLMHLNKEKQGGQGSVLKYLCHNSYKNVNEKFSPHIFRPQTVSYNMKMPTFNKYNYKLAFIKHVFTKIIINTNKLMHK